MPKVANFSRGNGRNGIGSGSTGSVVSVISTTNHSSNTIATLKHYQPKADAEEKRIRAEVGEKLSKEFAFTMKQLVNNGGIYASRSLRSFEDFLTSWYKSQIETGSSSGMLNPAKRRRMSEEMFGTEITTQPEEYEKYAFLGSKDQLEAFALKPGYGGRGSVMVEFDKDRLYGRATYSIGDTLDDYGAHIVPGMITKDAVSITGSPSSGWTTAADRMKSVIAHAKSSRYNPSVVGRSVGTDPYIEIQLHGKITPDYARSVTMTSTVASRLSQKSKDIMKQLGIKLIIR